MHDDYSEMKSALCALRSNAYNIQALLRMVQEGQATAEILEKINHVIENHFKRVESLDIDLPEANKLEHREIIERFNKMREAWRDGVLSDVDYAELLSYRLFSHFSTCLKSLLNAYLGDVFRNEFNL